MTRMDRRTFLATTLGATGALLVGSCSRSSQEPGPGPQAGRPTLRLLGGGFGIPSPFGYVAGIGYYRMSFIYDTLLWKDSSGQLLPWLATGFTRADDGTTYRFDLREDVQWHDGRPLTVDDVVFTFDYFKANTFSPLLVAQPEGVAEVRAVGGPTVEFRLERPFVTFLDQVAGAIPIVPAHVWSSIEDPGAERDLARLVGTGPYRLESFSEGEGTFLYTANDSYFLGTPYVERMELAPVGDQLLGVLGGQLVAGGASEVGPDALRPFQADPAFGVLESDGDFSAPLYFNLGRGGALADIRFRRACAHAIDRSGLVERIGGAGVPGNPGFLPPTHPFHGEVEQYAFDPGTANQLLDEAGYKRGPAGTRQGPDGQPLRFGLLVDQERAPVAELVVGALRTVGIEVAPDYVDLIGLFQNKTRGNYDMAIAFFPGPSGISANSDPDYLRRIYSSRLPPASQAVQGYQNGELDDLLDQQLVTQDEGERRALLARIQEIVARDLPVLPLYYSTQFFVFRKEVFEPWYYTPGGFGTGIPQPYNKQAFVTGRTTGLEIRPAD